MEVENENRVLEEIIAQNNGYIKGLEARKEELELKQTARARDQFASRKEEHDKKVDEVLQKHNDDIRGSEIYKVFERSWQEKLEFTKARAEMVRQCLAGKK